MGNSLKSAQFLIESRMREAARGDADALYDLGMVYASGAQGAIVDLIEAHKWFNLAAMSGSSAAQACRAEVADEMSAAEIAAAQKAARAWLQSGRAN
jgi:TPR repeat protein